MKNGDTPVSATIQNGDPNQPLRFMGLTKREHFALELMASICSGSAANIGDCRTNDYPPHHWPCSAESTAVRMADALLKELAK